MSLNRTGSSRDSSDTLGAPVLEPWDILGSKLAQRRKCSLAQRTMTRESAKLREEGLEDLGCLEDADDDRHMNMQHRSSSSSWCQSTLTHRRPARTSAHPSNTASSEQRQTLTTLTHDSHRKTYL